MKVDFNSTLPVNTGNAIKTNNKTEGENKGFAQVLNDAVKDVNNMQVEADKTMESFVLGETDELHQVMIASEEAKLSLQYMVQLRNKVVEAYQEISRMQI